MLDIDQFKSIDNDLIGEIISKFFKILSMKKSKSYSSNLLVSINNFFKFFGFYAILSLILVIVLSIRFYRQITRGKDISNCSPIEWNALDNRSINEIFSVETFMVMEEWFEFL